MGGVKVRAYMVACSSHSKKLFLFAWCIKFRRSLIEKAYRGDNKPDACHQHSTNTARCFSVAKTSKCTFPTNRRLQNHQIEENTPMINMQIVISKLNIRVNIHRLLLIVVSFMVSIPAFSF